MFKNIVLNAVIAALLASLLVACGESGEVDPYPQVTLQEVTRGMVVSKGMKYKSNPWDEAIMVPFLVNYPGALELANDQFLPEQSQRFVIHQY